jgi:hypothetical protein
MKKLSFKSFSIQMDAIKALSSKIKELGKKHPLENHYKNLIKTIQNIPADLQERFHERWLLKQRLVRIPVNQRRRCCR